MKKGIIAFLGVICLNFVVVHAATNPYPTTQNINGKISVPCTRVAWQETYDRLKIALPGTWGNAVNWLKNAKQDGYQIGDTPRPNSIAVYSGAYGYGHVAYVISVNENFMQIIEGGVEGKEKQERQTSYTIGSGSGIYLTGFIYLDEIPAKPKETTPTTTTPTKEPTPKDANSELQSLEVVGYSLLFQKDTYTYFLTVPYEQEKVTINAQAEKTTSTVEILNEYPLEIGENKISIKCIAEDSSTSEYIIYITREKKKEEVESPAIEKQETVKKTSLTPYIIVVVFAVMILSICFWKILRKKREKI